MWIAAGGIAIPLIVLTILFVLGLQLLRDFPIHGMQAGASHAEMMQSMKPEIRIVGHMWWWEIQYLNDDPTKVFTTANELHLPVGRYVNIEVQTRDVMHSFWVPALHGKVDLIPGQDNYIRLEASQAGNYTGQCAEFCGAEHARMRLLAVAQEPGDYKAWLDGQLKPGVQPTTPEAIAGQLVFLSGPCAMCHQVRGTVAGGRVAPDLTHIGSRQLIAANSYQNNDAYLSAWVTHAQSLKPEAQMPNLTQFSGEQLHDLVAYLRQLQ
jgi:cytochrome c oxidase subunit 2